MSGTVWSKFFWADWLSDVNLRRCSPAARGLWMDMLCVAAQAEPFGYLVSRGRVLTAGDVARISGMAGDEVEALMAELENANVFSRDRKGRIYSRRMVREARIRKAAQKTGKRGGNPTLCSDAEKSSTLKGGDKGGVKAPVGPISQKPEAKSQSPIATTPAALVARAARAMGVSEAVLRRRSRWIVFGDMVAGLVADGCEAERDVWPTIERLAKNMREPPASPLYFRAAILDARDRRLSGGGPFAASVSEWADRLAVFEAEGAWSSRWGPKPGEAGCLAPGISDQGSVIRMEPCRRSADLIPDA